MEKTCLGSALDANGNTLSDAQGRSLTWDFENRLIQAVVPGANGGTTTFKYDPFGRRIQKSGPLSTTNYLYDGSNSIEEVDNAGNVLARAAQDLAIDEPLAQFRANMTSYYEADGLGSISSLTNSTSALAATYSYDTFGNLSFSSGTISNPFHYTARDLDAETGIYYYRARYYDPQPGRFVSEDPLTFGGGKNFFTYTGNNPLVFADPSGLRRRSKICHLPPVGPHTKLPITIKRCASPSLAGCLMEVESGGDPNARSAAGAEGFWQVTPIMGAALQQYGLLTPEMSIDDKGHTYLNLLLSYCEDVSYAIAAYNAGPTAVNRAGGIPNYTETRNEVGRVDGCLRKQLRVPGGLGNPDLATPCNCK